MQLLRALPAATGMAFVLVQHLDPTHESQLSEVLSRTTAMPVVVVTDGMRVEPDRVHVIPPNTEMTIGGGALRLAPRETGQHMPIDHFLLSLAQAQKERAIGVVLSGSGSDGTLGLKAIKAEGGITVAQDEASAKYPSMPHSALPFADLVLAPGAIARELARIGRHPYLSGPPPSKTETDARRPEGGPDLSVVLRALHAATRVDFAEYKPSSVGRRIARRMMFRKIDDTGGYARILREDPREAQALYDDLLIQVTGFFREPDGFDALRRQVFPALVGERSPDDPIRVWVPGCCSGEEAYSLAISLLEFLAEQGSDVPIQIFATDLSASAIARARGGRFPESIAREVSPERLRRFFARDGGSFQVNKAVRDVCVFATQDLIKDPPFSRLDLISCCNVLIYFGAAAQERVIPVFHYALKPGGFLKLGAAEGIGRSAALFGLLDKKHKIYARKPGPATHLGFGLGAADRTGLLVPPGPRPSPARAVVPTVNIEREADRAVLERHAHAGVVVDANMQIAQFRGKTSAYLEAEPGVASLDLFKMARAGLRPALRQAVRHAAKSGEAVRSDGLRVRSNGEVHEVGIEVIPIGPPGAPSGRHYLVLFEEPAASAREVPAQTGARREPRATTPAARRVVELTRELAAAHQRLEATVEDHDAATEELRAATEELQSSNEELQSTNEELETSQEELQATNEELSTVNDELNNRNLELDRLSSDLANGLTSVGVPMIFMGSGGLIRRLTPATERSFNLVASDIGRTIEDLRLSVEVPELGAMLREVAETLTPREVEVQGRDGRRYSMRVRPYRTAEDKIDGAVISFIDIDDLKRALRGVEAARAEAEATLETVRGPLLILDADLRVLRANRSFYESFQVTPAATEGQVVYDLGNRQWDIPRLRTLLEEVLPQDNAVSDFEVEHEFERLGPRTMRLNARRVHTEADARDLILLAIEDVTNAKHLEEARAALLEREQALRGAAESATEAKDRFLAVLSHELRTPLQAMLGWIRLLRSRQLGAAHTERALDVIERNTVMQVRLIEDLLDVSRITAGLLQLELAPVMVAPEVQAAADGLRPAADAKGVRFVVSIEEEAGAIQADAARLNQMVVNLLSNAIKFTPSGGRVELRVARRGSQVEIRVRDTGAGISPDQLPHVFAPFGTKPRTRSEGGLGLGLGIVRHLAELHGGAVHAASAGLGHGATFTITLPLTGERPATEHLRDEGAASVPPDLTGLRVLVVEDDADTRDVLTVMLQEGGALVTAAASVEAALGALESATPDVLLSDLSMPERDGYDLIRSVRALDPARGGLIPAIALTAYARPGDRERVISAGFSGYLSKPIDFDELLATIATLAART